LGVGRGGVGLGVGGGGWGVSFFFFGVEGGELSGDLQDLLSVFKVLDPKKLF